MTVVPSHYKRRPRRPPFRRVLSVGTGVTSSAVGVRRRGGGAARQTNAANLEAGAGQRAQGRLRTGAGRLGAHAAGRTDLDVQRRDANLLQTLSNVLGSKHRRVGGRLQRVSRVWRPRQRRTSSRSAFTFIPPVMRTMVSLRGAIGEALAGTARQTGRTDRSRG